MGNAELLIVALRVNEGRHALVILLKSLLFGVGGAVMAVVIWLTVAFILPLYGPYLMARFRGTGGVSSAAVGSGSLLLAALIGFIVAFAWEWHRLRTA